MPHTPEIAILEQNTLAALGLRTILEELIPNAVIRMFSSFGQLIDDTPDMYAHYFVSAQIYFMHTAFFLERQPKTIVLSNGEHPQLNGVPTLNCTLAQDELLKAIVRLRQYGHHSLPPLHATAHDLSPREIEVLVLLTKGSRTAQHQPHHGHLAPQEHYRKAGHQVGVRPRHLCRDARIRGSRPRVGCLSPQITQIKIILYECPHLANQPVGAYAIRPYIGSVCGYSNNFN